MKTIERKCDCCPRKLYGSDIVYFDSMDSSIVCGDCHTARMKAIEKAEERKVFALKERVKGESGT